MPNLDQFFDRRMTDKYNCLDHTREVWKELTGEDLVDRLPGLAGQFFQRTISLNGFRAFKYLSKPVSPCIVVMQKPKERPHVGVYYRRRVMQITAMGVEYMPLDIATRDHTIIRFYQ